MTDKLNGKYSSKNSSSEPLSAAGTFTGRWEDVSSWDSVSFALRADTNCTLYVDFTSDSSFTVVDSTLEYKTVANINEVHRLTITRNFFRIRVTEASGADQTYLSLSSQLGSHNQLSAPLNLNISRDADATVVRPTIAEDEIVTEKRTGVRSFTKFGYRENLTAVNGEETIWANTAGNFTPLNSASTFTIAYNSTTDGSDGAATGAKTLFIQYIDSSGLPASAVHTLGNTGSDVTSFSGLGINRVSVSSSGSSDFNVNAVSITATTGGSAQAYVPASQSVTQQAIYFTSSNAYAVLKFLWINCNKLSGGGAPRVVVKAYVYNRNVDTRFEVFRVVIDTNTTAVLKIIDPVGFRLSPTDVLYFVADTDTNNATVNIRFSLIEYDND